MEMIACNNCSMEIIADVFLEQLIPNGRIYGWLDKKHLPLPSLIEIIHCFLSQSGN